MQTACSLMSKVIAEPSTATGVWLYTPDESVREKQHVRQYKLSKGLRSSRDQQLQVTHKEQGAPWAAARVRRFGAEQLAHAQSTLSWGLLLQVVLLALLQRWRPRFEQRLEILSLAIPVSEGIAKSLVSLSSHKLLTGAKHVCPALEHVQMSIRMVSATVDLTLPCQMRLLGCYGPPSVRTLGCDLVQLYVMSYLHAEDNHNWKTTVCPGVGDEQTLVHDAGAHAGGLTQVLTGPLTT